MKLTKAMTEHCAEWMRQNGLYPHYCDVIIARWEKLTGKKAFKVAAA